MKHSINLIALFVFTAIHPLSVDRVILATDDNPNYIQLWPIVAQAWKEVVGIRPTLVVVASKQIKVDETIGDVIYFEPLEGIPTSYQAQVIRLFAPSLFPDDVCLVSDIDMIPLQKSYFVDDLRALPEDNFVIYRDKASDWYEERKMYPMCYVAAKGKVFGEIFGVNEESAREKLTEWYALGLGWNTDEVMMARIINSWPFLNSRVSKLGRQGGQSIDRLSWHYDVKDLKHGRLFDAHVPRPYLQHKKIIDKLVLDLGLRSRLSEIQISSFSPAIAKSQFPCGGFEVTGELEVIKKLIKDGDLVLDVGANSGTWLQQVLIYHQPSMIIAFEPIKECAESIQKQPMVMVEECALSNRSGTMSFFKYPDETVLSSLYQRNRVENLLNLMPSEIQIKTATLDEYVKGNNTSFIHFLKIDVEGAEYDVLDGARDLLKMQQIAMIQFEYGSTYIDSKKTLRDVVKIFHEYGYVIFKILPTGLMHVPQWTSILEDYYQSNYLAVAPQYAYGWNSIIFRK